MLSHTVKFLQFGSFPMVWIFFYQPTRTNRYGINHRHLPSDRNCMVIPSNSSESNLLELYSQATFPQCYITYSQKLKNWQKFRWSGFFSYQITVNFQDGINFLHHISDRNPMDNPSISSKSNLIELFSQATFPQCYHTWSKT